MSTVLNTIRWLSIFTGALSLFFLANSVIEFGIGEVFSRIHAWYIAVVSPLVGVVRPTLDPFVLWGMRQGAGGGDVSGVGTQWFWDYGLPLVLSWVGAQVRAQRKLDDLTDRGWFGRSPLWLLLRDAASYPIAIVEFLKIALGALVFAALNAGLG
jgi:hypothetical protein